MPAEQQGTETATRPRPLEADQGDESRQLLAKPQGPDELGRLGAYPVRKVLGRGERAVVFLARDLQLKRWLALKAMLPSAASDPRARQRFLRQAQASAAIDHDHIIAIFEVGEERGIPFFAMPFLKGENLHERLRRQPRLPLGEVLRIGSEIAEGLAAAHERGLIHRDIKPSNIFLVSGGVVSGESSDPRPPLTSHHSPLTKVKILDFGLLREVEETGQRTQTAVIMAPEQGEGKADAQSDLFSLGCLLYQMCTGVQPFQDQDVKEATMRQGPPSPRELNPEVPASLAEIVMRLLAMEPSQRPESAGQVAATLRAIERDSAVTISEPSGHAEMAPVVAAPPSPEPAPPPDTSKSRAARAVRDTLSSRAFWIGSATTLLLALLLYQFTPTAILIITNRGEMLVKTDQPVHIVFTQEGQTVREVEAGSDQSFKIPAGEYEVEVTVREHGRPVVLRKKITVVRGESLDLDIRQWLAEVRKNLFYFAQINLADRAWQDAHIVRMDEILGNFVPEKSEQQDLRGFEWFYLRRLRLKNQVTCPHAAPIGTVLFSPDSRRVVTDGKDGKVWEVNGKELFSFKGQPLGFTPEGRLVCVLEKTIKILNPDTGEEISSRSAQPKPVAFLALCPAGRRLASADDKGTINIWDAATLKETATLTGHTGLLTLLRFSPDGNRVASGSSDGTVRLWDIGSGKEVLAFKEHKTWLRALAFSPDGKRLASSDGFYDGQGRPMPSQVRVWEADTGKVLLSLDGHTSTVVGLAFSPDDSKLASASYDRTVKLWDMASGRELYDFKGHTDALRCLAYSPNGKYLASGSFDQSMKLWEAKVRQEPRVLVGHQAEVISVAFSKENHLASLSLDGSIKVWEPSTGRLLTARRWPGVVRVGFSPEGSLLLGCAPDGKAVKAWDLRAGKEGSIQEEHQGMLQRSPDGTLSASDLAWDPTVKIRDAVTKQEKFLLKGHKSRVYAVAFSPDSKRLATASGDQTLKTWDLETGKELLTFKGHRNPVLGVVFSPDGQRLFSCAVDGSVKVWDVDTGQDALTLKAHGHFAGCVAISPDGKLLASGSADRTIRLWEADEPKAGLTRPTEPDDVITNSIGMKLKRIPLGKFLMGSGPEEIEREKKEVLRWAPPWRISQEGPQHEVRITKPFYMGVHEVTVGQFRVFVQETKYKTQAEKEGGAFRIPIALPRKMDGNTNWLNPAFEQDDQHPVVCVSWYDAKEFCAWLSKKEGKTYRLPTEAEWEYACRAGTTTIYSCGNDDNGLSDVANLGDESIKQEWPGFKHPYGMMPWNDGYPFTARVGMFQANAFGLHDMHGNVWEWLADWYAADYFAKSPKEDPQGPESGNSRVARGSSWFEPAWICRSALRNHGLPSNRGNNIGFRVVYDPDDIITNSIGMKLKRIPAGKFTMGSSPEEIERLKKEKLSWPPSDWQHAEAPQHKVRITKPFYMGVHEVTVGQFRQFAKATNYKTQAEKEGGAFRHFPDGSGKVDPQTNWLNPGFEQTDDHPVVCVSWNDAKEFCDWLSKKEGNSYRLPTEAEWEYVCRAGSSTRYCCGDDKQALKDFANLADDSIKLMWPAWPYPSGKGVSWDDGHPFTAPVGRFQPNAFGLYDMHGNVWEYKKSDLAVEDPKDDLAGGSRVYRGGSWGSVIWNCRSACRVWGAPGSGFAHVGLRVVYVPEDMITNSIGMKLKRIPAGNFLMGSTPDEIERVKKELHWQPRGWEAEAPQHEVRITKPFYMGIHEVTLGQFRQFVQATGYKTQADREGGAHRRFPPNGFEKLDPSCNWLNPGFEQTDEHPVVCVSWNDAKEFCDWLSRKESKTYRLPTEAEWEYACRAESTTQFCSGNDRQALKDFANAADESLKQKLPGFTGIKEPWNDGYPCTAPVGKFKANAFGLYDMHGNVFEWSLDGLRKYEKTAKPVNDPIGDMAGRGGMYRGGGWLEEAWNCRSACRHWHRPSERYDRVGFRVVYAPDDIIIPQFVNLKELNQLGDNGFPWLSPDGLTIYWSWIPGKSIVVRDSWIWTASRADPTSPFTNKQKLFPGTGPVLSPDGLELYFRPPDREGISLCSRASVDKPFAEPRPIVELQFPGTDPAVRFVSADGLTLFLDRRIPARNNWFTWISTRKDRGSPWEQPRLVETSIKGRYAQLRFVQVYATADGLRLLCTAETPGTSGLGVLSRPKPTGPYTSFEPISLNWPKDINPIGFAPRYVAATRELFVAFFSTQGANLGVRDLWVIKNFTLPPSAAISNGISRVDQRLTTDFTDITDWTTGASPCRPNLPEHMITRRFHSAARRNFMNPSDQQRLLSDVEDFCQEIREHEELCYVEHRFNHHVIPLAQKYGILGMIVPPEYGGRGTDALTYARTLARIGREGTGVRTFFSGHTSIGQYPILAWGNEEQKRRYLPASCTGEKILAFGLTEPEAGSNPLEMHMTYERQNDRFILNGVKYLISNAGIASAIVTFAYPLQGPKRISAFIIDTDGPGFSREDLVAKMGMPTANTGMFELVNYQVPETNLLGPEGDGFRIAMGTLVSGRLSVAAGCLGVIEDCLAESINYAKERQQHGKAIAKHQLVQEHIAAIEMHRLATEALVFKAAEAKEASAQNPEDGEVKARAELLAAQTKLFAANAAWDAADRAVQVFGGRGWSTLYRPGRHLQDVRVCRIYEGTDEILKLKIAAAVLGGKEYEAYK